MKMNCNKFGKCTLPDYLEGLQSQGRYYFTKEEALNTLNCKESAFDRAIIRLSKKGKLLSVKPGFFSIVPPEYKSWGNLPPEWIIKDLMTYLKSPYYVGLLSSAAIYGAAHQQLQSFQVVTTQPIRPINKKKLRIEFIKNDKIHYVPTTSYQTHTGSMKVSTPEATALDLVRFYKRVGYFNNITTVLTELAEKINPKVLIETIDTINYEWPVVQRLGYLLSLKKIGGEELIKPLADKITESKPRFVPLVPNHPESTGEKNQQWRLIINDRIEEDFDE